MNGTQKLWVVVSMLLSLCSIVIAAESPAYTYCTTLGYEYIVVDPNEDELEICIMPEGTQVDAWAFLRGEVAQEFNICGIEGLETEQVEDLTFCSGIASSTCARCAGTDVEVSVYMGLTECDDCEVEVCTDCEVTNVERNPRFTIDRPRTLVLPAAILVGVFALVAVYIGLFRRRQA